MLLTKESLEPRVLTFPLPANPREKHGTFRLLLRINKTPYALMPGEGVKALVLTKETPGFEKYLIRRVNGLWVCDCPDYKKLGPVCKHGAAMDAALRQLKGALR